MPISSRSTAAVDSRSSHSPMANGTSLAKFRAKARVDCARGPSLPSMLIGRPRTESDGGALVGERQEPRGVGGEGLAADGLDAGGEPAVRIGHRDPDGLGAEVEPDQGAPHGPVRGGLRQR